jgi:hypothetical protein
VIVDGVALFGTVKRHSRNAILILNLNLISHKRELLVYFSDQPQSAQVAFSPICIFNHISESSSGEGITSTVIVNDYCSAFGMTVNMSACPCGSL